MNSVQQLLALLPAGGWERLLCDALWQGTLIATLGLFAARCLTRHAAARAWVLLLTATACIAVPLASAASRSAGWTVLARAEADASEVAGENGRMGAGEIVSRELLMNLASPAEVTPVEVPISLPAKDAIEAMPTDQEPAPPAGSPTIASSPLLPFSPSPILSTSSAATPELNWLHPLALVWLTASALLALRLAFSALAVRKILRQAKPCDDGRLHSAAGVAAARVGLKETPPVLVSDRIESPMVLALAKPRLLVPHCSPLAPREGACEQSLPPLTNADTSSHASISRSDMSTTSINWTAAFTHELAHVARRDGWSRLWMELVAIALPLEPLVWLVRRNFHLACEEACDDWSVAAGSDPVDLAETLTAWLGHRTPRPATAIGMSSTKARVLRLLAMRETPKAKVPRVWRWMSVPVLLFVIASLAVAQVRQPDDRDNGRNEPPANSPPEKEPETAPARPVELMPRHTDEKSDASLQQLVEQALSREPALAKMSETIERLEQFLKDQERAVKNPESDPTVRMLKAELATARQEFAARKEKVWPAILEIVKKELDGANVRRRPLPPYVIEPPDILLIDAIRIVPKPPVKIQANDVLALEIGGAGFSSNIRGLYLVEAGGKVNLGTLFGKVKVGKLTIDEASAAITKHLKQTLTDPQVSLTLNESGGQQQIAGEHLVAPDGTVNLGVYGLVYVAGLSVTEAKGAIEKHLSEFLDEPLVAVDVYAYNSKFYYVVIRSPGQSDNIHRFPVTGNETVLDAVANVGKAVASEKIYVSRHDAKGKEVKLEVTWEKLLQGGSAANFKLLPGDRVFVESGEKSSAVTAPPVTPFGYSQIPPDGGSPAPPRVSSNMPRYSPETTKPNTQWSMPNALDSNVIRTPHGAAISPFPNSAIPLASGGNYFVIVKGVKGRLDNVGRFPLEGDDTVADALSQVDRVMQLRDVRVWVLRPAADNAGKDQTLDVNWEKILSHQDNTTDHKLQPGDRVFVTGGRFEASEEPAPQKSSDD